MQIRVAILAALAALAIAAPSASAIAPGHGMRGTMTMSWGNTAGAPITQWDGGATLYFDPSAAARNSTITASKDPMLGEPTRPLYAPQVQAARATSVAYTRTENVTCLGTDAEGNNYDYPAVATSASGSITDPRIAYEILPPRLDLIAGRGTAHLQPYAAPSNSGWWVGDRFALPGRFRGTYNDPCPPATFGDDGVPDRDPRIMAVNGAAAVPRVITDYLNYNGRAEMWPVRKTSSGWRVMINYAKRETFSESIYGPQDTQQMDVKISSNLYLTGNLAALEAWCRVPTGLIARATTSRGAVSVARRAGLPATYAGVKRVYGLRKAKFGITGFIGMGHGTCNRGTYKVWHYRPR